MVHKEAVTKKEKSIWVRKKETEIDRSIRDKITEM